MNHSEILELLPAYVDQELGIADALAVERHLRNCPDCQQEYAGQRTASARVKKAATYFNAPADLGERLGKLLPEDATHTTRRRDLMLGWLNIGAALAALLMTAWSVGLYLSMPSPQDRLMEELVSSHVRSLQIDHLSDVASSDQHTVKPWFNGKLNFSPPVVDLAAQGYPLIGGRLDYLDGRAVAVLIYRHRQHPINLYIWPSAHSDAAPRLQDRQGYHLVRWTQGDMDCWAVSDLSGNELEHFASAVRSAIRQ